MPGIQQVPATGNPEDSCSPPQARGAPHSYLACQGHPDSSGSTEAGKHAAGSPHMPPQPQLFRRCTSFSSASRVTPGWGQQLTHGSWPTDAHSYRCVCPSSCRGQPGTEASPQPGGSGRPSAAPTPCRLPPCSHLCTTMSGIFLSAQLGGRWRVGLGALPAPGTWPKASPPSSPHACPPAHQGWQGRAGPRPPNSLGARRGHTPSEA